MSDAKTISVYVDASWDMHSKIAALAAVFFDGTYYRDKSVFCEDKFLENSNLYEVEAIYLAMSYIEKSASPGSRVIIFTDSKYSVNYLGQYMRDAYRPLKVKHKEFKPLLRFLGIYRKLQENSITVELRHVKDEQSLGLKTAHKIANYSRRNFSKELGKKDCWLKCKEAALVLQEKHEVLLTLT